MREPPSVGATRLRANGITAAFARARPIRRWDDTDDVVQNAAIRFLRALDDTTPEGSDHLVNLATLQIRREPVDLARKHRGPESQAANHESNALRVDGRLVMRVDVADDPHTEEPGIDRWTAFHAVECDPPGAGHEAGRVDE